VRASLRGGPSLNLASGSGLGHDAHARRPILSGDIVACPPIPQACRPSPCDWRILRFARSVMRELWLVSGCVVVMTFDWTWDRSNFTTGSTIARNGSAKRVSLVGAVTAGQALEGADLTANLQIAAQHCKTFRSSNCRRRCGASLTPPHR
jgi:hypothetical protein